MNLGLVGYTQWLSKWKHIGKKENKSAFEGASGIGQHCCVIICIQMQSLKDAGRERRHKCVVQVSSNGCLATARYNINKKLVYEVPVDGFV